ncbi:MULTISPECIES: shikimate dehydrogenase [Pelosinus]|jgi:shikimate dehydrogenase|uniref:Shikimate dehydrogenase (NADP(+)) n=1 Tax=Pelosinus fermentans B4 TaxID=1149862 RepID=I9LCX9_9FIRM|nr:MULTISPECIES: shikimate dehydrogenase [Pelosinus]EIW18294.1 shikimate 5-dehydrogenase [Pelosinus fermentans B4]EIW24280.1 Shikimate dehydrogenase [Pelosinus fermentans A11]OAM94274.1 Shikimate dehydrogenase [Pelosinus fermentans DSM 17108]SDR04837.1 shikimate dehydrogenase [Pelosinus fermentans]
MITSKTKKIGILGWPLGHSLSPIMHNAAFKSLHLDYVYIPLPVHPENLAQAVAGLKAMEFTGVNVTIPHKVEIMSYLDEIDFSAQLVGAVNTVVIKDGKTIGYNTDAQGFVQSILSNGIKITEQTAIILGAGGAARAVACGLFQNGIKNIIIGARNLEKAQQFVKLFSTNVDIQAFDWEDSGFQNLLQECDILINSTPIGMSVHDTEVLPIPWETLNPEAAVCDLIYNPSKTQLLLSAEEHGHIAINGLGMLIEQGALAFELWTSEQGPRQIMSEALTEYL